MRRHTSTSSVSAAKTSGVVLAKPLIVLRKRPNTPQIFLSYSRDSKDLASLLQYALERDLGVNVWTYERDQLLSENEIAKKLKAQVKASDAFVFLVSPFTLQRGATQWMELAYADAFEVPTFVMMHQLTFELLKRQRNTPPLLLASRCSRASEWRILAGALRRGISEHHSRSRSASA